MTAGGLPHATGGRAHSLVLVAPPSGVGVPLDRAALTMAGFEYGAFPAAMQTHQTTTGATVSETTAVDAGETTVVAAPAAP